MLGDVLAAEAVDTEEDFRIAIQGLCLGRDTFQGADGGSTGSDGERCHGNAIMSSCSTLTVPCSSGSIRGLTKKPSSWNLIDFEFRGEDPDGMPPIVAAIGMRRSNTTHVANTCSMMMLARPRSLSCDCLSLIPLELDLGLEHPGSPMPAFDGRANFWEVDESEIFKYAIMAHYGKTDHTSHSSRRPQSAPAHRPVMIQTYGLTAEEHAKAARTYGANQLPASLPDVHSATISSFAYIVALRPAAMATGTLSLAHLAVGIFFPNLLQAAACRPRTLGMTGAILAVSAAVIGTGRFLERYVSAFDRLREHIRLYAYALALGGGHEEEELAQVTRSGVQCWVPCTSLVPGDVIHLQQGRVPADSMLVQASNLEISCPLGIAGIWHRREHPGRVSPVWNGWRSLGMGAIAAAQDKLHTRLSVHTEHTPSASYTALGSGMKTDALATSIVLRGKATAIVTRTGADGGAFNLLLRMSSLSLVEVLLLMCMGGVKINNIQN